MGQTNHWLIGEEKDALCEALLEFGLLKFSNKRDLPLKKGGTTDIYINLRDARDNPEAIEFISKQFMNPLLRLNPDRFAEVPDSVSCFAGSITTSMKLPYITIREEAKAGRVSNAKIIGNAKRGEVITVIDDVITDGASKIPCYSECLKRGLVLSSLVVLVDRQQGWKEKFQELGLNWDVWAGMSLHDVRRYLIENGIMERCNEDIEEKNPIIVALDGKSWEEILPIVDQLRTTGCILKVNDLLLNKGIENLIPDLQVYGRVMADIKGHDIGNTLSNISKHFLKNPPWAVTVHGSGGEDMIRAVVETLKGTGTKVLVVTVLTSMDEKNCNEIYYRMPAEQVQILANIAERAGAHGLVCSPQEVGDLRKIYPDMTLVTPGIRSAGKDAGDQKRIGTPEEAMKNGANNLVMGRQFLESSDPVAEVKRVLKEELGIATP